MGKKQKQHSKIFKNSLKILTTIGLLGGSTGLVFGLSNALGLKQNFVNIKPYQFAADDNINPKIAADYRSLPQSGYWNCKDNEPKDEINDVYISSQIDYISSQIDDTNPLKTLNNDPSVLYSYASLITDGATHSVLDKSFNESAYLGLVNWVHQKDKKLNDEDWKAGDDVRIANSQLEISTNTNDEYKDGFYIGKNSKPSEDNPNGFLSTYTAEINKMVSPSGLGKGSLLLSGYLHETPLAMFSNQKQDLYNKSTYTILDGGLQSNRCASVYYRADQSAFLCGIATCQYLQDRYNNVFSKINHGKLAVGTFGGIPIPTVTSFMGGFEWGIYIYNKYFLPKYDGYNEWDEQTKQKRTVGLICVGRSDSFYSNSFVTGEAKFLVQQLLMQGADAILPVAGPQTIDVVNEIRNQSSPAITIGVDTDQENSDIGQYTSKSKLNYGDKIIQFSARKNLAGIGSTIFQARSKGVRGYYYDENYNVKYLDYDKIPLAKQDDKIKRSFIGNSGYATVGTVYNKGAGISLGAPNIIDQHTDDELCGTGWESLVRALKLISESEYDETNNDWKTYNGLIKILLGNKFVKENNKEMNVFEFLEDNKYFVYR